MNFFESILGKSILEGLRVAILSAIPVLIDGISNGVINWSLVGMAMVVSVLRSVDKYLHLVGKDTDNESLTKGLVRF